MTLGLEGVTLIEKIPIRLGLSGVGYENSFSFGWRFSNLFLTGVPLQESLSWTFLDDFWLHHRCFFRPKVLGDGGILESKERKFRHLK
jgi:hypothetical protein